MKEIFKKKNITIVQSVKEPNLFYISHPSTSVGVLINDKDEILLVE